MISFTLNRTPVTLNIEADTPLLWAIRDHLGLLGTKFGCGVGACGACTVHLNGRATRSCILPVGAVQGQEITTIEGLDHPVKRAWIEEQVPQCGYCQPGQMMAASALLGDTPRPTDADIDRAMTNLCRCATYDRIRRGIHRAAELLPPPPEPPADQGARTPTDQGTRTQTDQGTRTPADQGARTPADQGARTPADQGARTPADQGARTQTDQGTRTPADQGARTPADQDPKARTGEDAEAPEPQDPE